MRFITPAILLSTLLPLGCQQASTTTTPAVSQGAQDIALIATALPPLITSIEAVPGVSPATIATLNADLAVVQQDAAAVAAATSAPSTTTVQQIAVTVESLAPLLATIPGAAPYVPVAEAAIAVAQVLVAEFSAPAKTTGVADVSQQRIMLRAFAASHAK